MSDVSLVSGTSMDSYVREETVMTPPMEELTKQERINLFGVDCGDGMNFGSAWIVGHEYTRILLLKNVITQTIKITYTLPAGKNFVMDFPETLTLAPGAAKSIPVRFRPVHMVDHFDFITISTSTTSDKVEQGSFIISVRATVPKLAVYISPVVDLGPCAVYETSAGRIILKNTGGTAVHYRFLDTVLRTDFQSPIDESVGKSDMSMPFSLSRYSGVQAPNSAPIEIKLSFVPEFAHAFKFLLKCLVSEQEVPVDSTPDTHGVQLCTTVIQAQCLYPFVSLSQQVVDFGPVVSTSVLTHSISLRNLTDARTSWSLEEAFPQQMSPYTLSQSSGVLEPRQITELSITYSPQVAFQEHNTSFFIVLAGKKRSNGSSLDLLGRSLHIPVKIDKRCIDFGQVTLPSPSLPGQSNGAAPVQKSVLTLFNSAAVPAYYTVLITSGSAQAAYSRKTGNGNGTVFSVSHSCGEIASLLSTTVTFSFSPAEPGNYWARAYILVHQQEPLIIDLVGNAKDHQIQPLPLVHEHIQAFRLRQMLHPLLPFVSQQNCLALAALKPKMHERILRILNNVRLFAAESAVTPTLRKHELPHALRVLVDEDDLEKELVFPCSPKQMFAATTLDPVELSQYVLDVSAGENQVIVTSRTSFKQVLTWSVHPSVQITPQKIDLLGGDSVTFTFAFTPSSASSVAFIPLSLYCAPMHQKTFRIAHSKAMVPPSYVGQCVVQRPTGSDAYTSPVAVEPVHLNFGAVLEDSYQSLKIVNEGSSNSFISLDTSHPNISVLPRFCMLRPGAHAVVLVRVNASNESVLNGHVLVCNGAAETISVPIIATHPAPTVVLPHKLLALPPSVPGSVAKRQIKVNNPHSAPIQFRIEGLSRISVQPRCAVIAPGHFTTLTFTDTVVDTGTDEVARILTSFCSSVPERALDDVLISAQQLAVKKGEEFGSGSVSLHSPLNHSKFQPVNTLSKPISNLQESTLRQQLRQGLTKPSEDLGEEHIQLLQRSTGVTSDLRFNVSLPKRGTPRQSTEEETSQHVYSRGQQAHIEAYSDCFDEHGVMVLGAAQLGLACSKTVLLVNKSGVDVQYSLHIKKRQPRTTTRPSSAVSIHPSSELTLSPATGIVRAHSSCAISASFSPTAIGLCQFDVTCNARKQILCQFLVECTGNSPTQLVRYATALLTGANRVLHGTHAWENVQADLINSYLLSPPGSIITDSSALNLRALATKTDRQFLQGNEPTPIPIVPVYFPTFALQRSPILSTFAIELFNPTQVECKWTLSPPVDLSHQWDAGQPTHVEILLHKVTDQQLFSVGPAQGTLAPGDSVTVLISYLHARVGLHRLPVILRAGNKSIGLVLTGRTELPYPQLLSPMGENRPMFQLNALEASHTTYVQAAVLNDLLVPSTGLAWPQLVFPEQQHVTSKTSLVPIQHLFTASTVCSTLSVRNKAAVTDFNYTHASDVLTTLIELTRLITTDLSSPVPTGVCFTLNNPTPVAFLVAVQPGTLLHHPFQLVCTTIDSPVVFIPPCSSYTLTVRIHSATPMYALNLLTFSCIPVRDQVSIALSHPDDNAAIPHPVNIESLLNMPEDVLLGVYKPSVMKAGGMSLNTSVRSFVSQLLLHTLITGTPLEYHVPISPALAIDLQSPSTNSSRQLEHEIQRYESFIRSLQARQLPIPHHAEMYEEACTPLPVFSPPSLISSSRLCLATSYCHTAAPNLPCPSVTVSNHVLDIHPLSVRHAEDAALVEEVDPSDVNNFSTVSDVAWQSRRTVIITNTSAKSVGVNVAALNVADFVSLDEPVRPLDPALPCVVAYPASFTLEPQGEVNIVLYIIAGSTPVHYQLVIPITVDALQVNSPDLLPIPTKKPIAVSVQTEADEAEAVKSFCEQRPGVFGTNTSLLECTLIQQPSTVEPDILKIDTQTVLRRLVTATCQTQIRINGWVQEKQ